MEVGTYVGMEVGTYVGMEVGTYVGLEVGTYVGMEGNSIGFCRRMFFAENTKNELKVVLETSLMKKIQI